MENTTLTDDQIEAQEAAREAWKAALEGTGGEAQMTEAQKIATFILAGNATFTIASQKTGARFTFRVRAKDKENPSFWFVAVLTGNDNENDYEYLGTLGNGAYRHGKKSRIAPDAGSAKAFAWFWKMLQGGELPAVCEFFHAGKCGRCGRTLTVPESVASGLGPECATRVM
jgi:Family of unknown function (DUF6011)